MSQQRATRGVAKKLLRVPDHPIGYPGYHDPTTELGGPIARSALTARLVIAAIGFVACTAAAVLCIVFHVPNVPTGIAAFCALAFGVDILIVVRRKLSGEPG
jgi:hypothetical protein